MNEYGDIQGMQVDERTEVLINRYLDGELSDAQQAELHAILGRDPAARAMLEQYHRNDALVAQALRRGIESTMTATAPGRRRGTWLAIASSGLAAAAVFVFSIAPQLPHNQPNQTAKFAKTGGSIPVGVPTEYTFAEPVHIPQVPARLVDYRDDDLMPQRRQQLTDRELIGVRGDDGRLYLIERNVKSTRVAPMAGEY